MKFPRPACMTDPLHGSRCTMTLDHIVPRAARGTDDPSNLQFMCRGCNSQKHTRPDGYWKRDLFFDQAVNFEKARQGQKRAAESILAYPSIFASPANQLSGMLFLFVGVTGMGKTLLPYFFASAINRCVRLSASAAGPRVDRVLVLTKDAAIRDQTGAALSSDLVQHGILGSAPRVKVITSSSELGNEEDLRPFDFVVSCAQMLWTEGGIYPAWGERLLAQFPLIIFDEMHYAREQIVGLVERARMSTCIGMTATPIDALGRLLDRTLLLGSYTYNDACALDGSMKLIPEEESEYLVELFDEADATRSYDNITERAGDVSSSDVREAGYDRNLVPVLSVARETLPYLRALDQVYASSREKLRRGEAFLPEGAAEHRYHCRLGDPLPRLWYPAHALIVAPSVSVAERVADDLNRYLDQKRDEYPAALGYHAAVVSSQGDELGPDHPWFWCWRRIRPLDIVEGIEPPNLQRAVRILIVVDMAREGVDNPYCAVVALANANRSSLESIQRAFGRQCRGISQRAVVGLQGTLGEVLKVPHPALDTVHIITHRTFGNREAIRRAADWLVHMADYLADLPTVAEMEKVGPARRRTLEHDPDLGGSAGVARLFRELGTRLLDGSRIDPAEIAELLAVRGTVKHSKAQGLLEDALNNPGEVATRLFGEPFRAPALPPQRIVIEETIELSYDRQYRRDFLMSRYPELVPRFDSDPARESLWVDPLIEANRRGFSTEIPHETSIAEVVFNTAMSINQNWIGELCADPDEETFEAPTDTFLNSSVYHATERACCDLLSVPSGTRLIKGCRWDKAQYEAILLHPANQKAICGWVVGELVRKGQAPKLAAIFDRAT